MSGLSNLSLRPAQEDPEGKLLHVLEKAELEGFMMQTNTVREPNMDAMMRSEIMVMWNQNARNSMPTGIQGICRNL
jgi:hypothetical protein